MKTRLTIICLILLSISISANAQHYWIKNTNIINVENGDVLEEHHIEIKNGKIIRITDKEIIKGEAEVIDGTGKFIIPGLWDMHVHTDMVGKSSIPLFVNYGVTGLRDMGGNINTIRAFAEDSSKFYPKIITAGPILESPRFYQLTTMLLGKEIAKSRISFDSPDRAGQIVDSVLSLGADFIKIRTVQSMEAFNALAEACKERNVRFTGHIDQNINILEAVKSGISTIEHSDFFAVLKLEQDSSARLAKRIAQEDVMYTPTLIATEKSRLTPKSELLAVINDSSQVNYPYRKYLSPKLLEHWMLEVSMAALESPMDWGAMSEKFMVFGKELAHSDTKLLTGTDTGVGLVIPGLALHEELKLMVERFNITNLQALQSATINAAEQLELGGYGKVENGFAADLLVLNYNPLENINHTKDIHAVINNGHYLDNLKREKSMRHVVEAVKKERLVHQNDKLVYFNEALQKLKASKK